MDELLKTVKEIQELANFNGSPKDFITSKIFLSFCSKHNLIPSNLKKSDMNKECRDLHIDYLVSLTQDYIDDKNVTSWEEFKTHNSNKKVWKILFDFGVRGELEFDRNEAGFEQESLTKLTFEEFYELCQIQFHYDGSFRSFKKMIVSTYGSFTEYCLKKGYDINNTKWECEETALRVAQKIGSLERIKEKSPILYKYLHEKNIHKKIA